MSGVFFRVNEPFLEMSLNLGFNRFKTKIFAAQLIDCLLGSVLLLLQRTQPVLSLARDMKYSDFRRAQTIAEAFTEPSLDTRLRVRNVLSSPEGLTALSRSGATPAKCEAPPDKRALPAMAKKQQQPGRWAARTWWSFCISPFFLSRS